MTWTDTRDAIQAAIPTAGPLYQTTGKGIVADFDRWLAHFGSIGQGLPQPSETGEHVTWRTTTMPGFIGGLLEVASLLDGAPAGSAGDDLRSELKRAKERLNAALKSAPATLQALGKRAAAARAPEEPSYFDSIYTHRAGQITSGGQEQTITAASIARTLDKLEAEASQWLELVGA